MRSASWAASLDEDEFATVLQGISERCYPAGAVIAATGEPADHWLGVLAGMVKVDSNLPDGKGTTFIGLGAGGWLGEGALLKKEPRAYDVVALHDTRMAFMRRESFDWLYQNSLGFNHFLVGHLNDRLGQFVSIMERARLHSTLELIAYGLTTLVTAAERRVCISQEELGRMCGVSRQLAARGLHKLVEDGLINIEYGAIHVKDVQGLRSAARI